MKSIKWKMVQQLLHTMIYDRKDKDGNVSYVDHTDPGSMILKIVCSGFDKDYQICLQNKLKGNWIMNTQLLCSFSTRRDYKSIIDIVKESYDVVFKKIYLLENLDNNRQLMLTYNVVKGSSIHLPQTISLHRKKQTNTLYTINAINEIVILLNDGSMDKNFPIPWENYSNSMLLTGDEGLKVIKTKLYKIIDV